MSSLLAEQMLVVFAILAIGAWFGSLSWRGVSLGNSAVFFVGRAFGHFGLTIPTPVMDLCLLLFVYAVGLPGRPILPHFRRQGRQFVTVARALLAAGIVTVLLARRRCPMRWRPGFHRRTHQYTILAARSAVGRLDPGQAATVSVGYGISLSISLVGVSCWSSSCRSCWGRRS